MRRYKTFFRCAVVGAGLALTAGTCSSPADDKDVAAEAPSTAVEATTSEEAATEAESSESSAATPTGSGLIELELGEAFTTDIGNEITAHEVRVDIPFDFESDDGGGWHTVDVSYCLFGTVPDPAMFQEFAFGWILRTEEGYVMDYPSSSWDDIVSPKLDLYHVAPVAGKCYRGWILIDGPADVTVTSARFYEVDWAVADS